MTKLAITHPFYLYVIWYLKASRNCLGVRAAFVPLIFFLVSSKFTAHFHQSFFHPLHSLILLNTHQPISLTNLPTLFTHFPAPFTHSFTHWCVLFTHSSVWFTRPLRSIIHPLRSLLSVCSFTSMLCSPNRSRRILSRSILLNCSFIFHKSTNHF